jgi:DNA-binding MarR family transcriptional regulator
MKAHIELLSAYDKFLLEFPKRSIEEFYSHMATKSKRSERNGKSSANASRSLMKSIGRLTNCFNLYLRTALKEQEMEVPEGYPFLAALNYNGEMRKSDLINFNLVEISTGMEIIKRLKKYEFINEKSDKSDKRVKLVSITVKGKIRLMPFLKIAANLRSFIFSSVSEKDAKMCLSVLEPLEIKHSWLVVTERNEIVNKIK